VRESREHLTSALSDRYHIERELGQGGMATVYLAHDLKHDRKVALKVLKPELAAVLGADRFVQEIRTTANLQHPHILPLFDSGEADGFLYYVMPYVDGETLREKLDRETQLGVDEAVKIATEVADALDYAHRQEVIHRDIKPENILLHDGRPMVADFGIALALSAAAGGRMTETGLSLGTPHYMSPEQATAERQVTHRSDIYSLGCVLYEMLAGDPTHTGSSAQAIILKIIADSPRPVAELRKSVPPNVAAAVAIALEKLPADRFGSAAAFAGALRNPGFNALTSAQATAGSATVNRRLVVGLAGVTATAILLGAWGWLRNSPATDPPVVTRFTLDLGQVALAAAPGRLFDVAPDGSAFVILGTDSTGLEKLFLRRGQDALPPVPLLGTEGARNPVFSPDGEWVAFAQNGDLKKVRVSGGTPLEIARGANPMQLHWGAGDRIVFSLGGQGRAGIYTVAGSGGTPVLVSGTDSVANRLLWPELLPDGRTALVTLWRTDSPLEIGVLDLVSGDVTVVIEEGTHAHYLPTGHLAYGHPSGGVFAVAFDLRTHSVTGNPVPVLEDVAVFGGSAMFSGGAAQFAVSSTGLVITSGTDEGRTELVRVDTAGRVTPIPAEALSNPGPRFSPDGRFIAYEDGPMGTQRDIYVYDQETGTRVRLTHEGLNRYATWSPDSSWIYFGSQREGSPYGDTYRRRADGSGDIEWLTWLEGPEWIQAILPDGQLLVRTTTTSGANKNLLIMTPGDSVATPFLADSWNEEAAKVSPDGRWVAYTSDDTGVDEVYVTSFPGNSGGSKVSEGGGTEPVWDPDGHRLFYRTGDALIAAVVSTGSLFTVTGRKELFRGSFARYPLFAQYDIHPDGTWFVMFRGAANTGSHLVVAVNWFSELRERMGEGG